MCGGGWTRDGGSMNIDADPRNADWIKVVGRAREFSRWTKCLIDEECGPAYRRFHAEVRTRHLEYFAERSEARSLTNLFSARDRRAAFPSEWSHLADTLTDTAWHRYHLSGGSSQTLAIAMLATAQAADPSMAW